MTHTILIPHRGRLRHLQLCLESIGRSAALTGCRFFVLVVGETDAQALDRQHYGDIAWAVIPVDAGEPFNKSRCLNAGMRWIAEDKHYLDGLVTVLDADAIVGPQFLAAAESLAEDPALTRVCYRVRALSIPESQSLLAMHDRTMREAALDSLRKSFNEPHRFRHVWEAYRFPDRDRYEPEHQPWGNSQFTMRAADLAGLEYDEGEAGHGFEDIDFNRLVYRKFGADFRGRIWTDADHAMFHLSGTKELSWDKADMRNLERYKQRWPSTCAELESSRQQPWAMERPELFKMEGANHG